MRELEIQKSARNGQLNFVCERNNIDIKEETDGIHKYLLLDYTIRSPKDSELVRDCRGLVLRKDNYSIVRYMFRRFMNYGEIGQDRIDFACPFIIQEKVDGSLMSADMIHGKWNLSTRGAFIPTQKLDCGKTFPELFLSIVGESFLDNLNPNIHYTFELCSLYNRVVVPYITPTIYLIGARSNYWIECGKKWLDQEAKRINVSRPKEYVFDSINAVVKHAEKIGSFQEGFVIVQEKNSNASLCDFHRVKIKGDAYLALHKVVASKSVSSLVELVVRDDKSITTEFPEYEEAFVRIQDGIDNLCKIVDTTFLSIGGDKRNGRDAKDRGAFANEVISLEHVRPYQHVLYLLLDKKHANTMEYVQDIVKTKSGVRCLTEMIKAKDLVDESWSVV